MLKRITFSVLFLFALVAPLCAADHSPSPTKREAAPSKPGFHFYYVLEDMGNYLNAGGEPIFFPKLETSIDKPDNAVLLSQFLLEKGSHKPSEHEKKILGKPLKEQKLKGIIIFHPLKGEALCYVGNITVREKALFPLLPKCQDGEHLKRLGGVFSSDMTEGSLQRALHHEKQRHEIEEQQRKAAITYQPQVPKAYQNRDVISLYAPEKNKATLNCPKTVVATLKMNYKKIDSIVDSLNFDPKDCLWNSLDKTSKSEGWGRIAPVGYSFGTVMEPTSKGYMVGTELVIMKVPGEEALMVGTVGYHGFDLSLSTFPGGLSVEQSVIHGDCKDGIFGYLGWFSTVGSMGISKNYGKNNFFDWKDTHCNSTEITRGTTTGFLNYSRSYFYQMGQFAIVRGQRILPFLENLRARNPRLP